MLGAIVTSYNDGYKLKEWKEHYDEMRAIIGRYIIIDNGSDPMYINQVKETFPEADIFELGSNKGTTGAYNAGITDLLKDRKIKYIMLVGNDIRISAENISKQLKYLEEHEEVGMVAPILLKKDSMIIEDGGCKVNKWNYTLNPDKVGLEYERIGHVPFYVDAVTGGMNIAKRSFYETVGLQDELLFMYSDEVDMGIRALRKGIKMAVVADSYAWHQHINPNNTVLRHPYSAFLMGRNKIYLAYKHGSKFNAFCLYSSYLVKDHLRIMKSIFQRDSTVKKKTVWHLKGATYGLRHDMNKNKYTTPEE